MTFFVHNPPPASADTTEQPGPARVQRGDDGGGEIPASAGALPRGQRGVHGGTGLEASLLRRREERQGQGKSLLRLASCVTSRVSTVGVRSQETRRGASSLPVRGWRGLGDDAGGVVEGS